MRSAGDDALIANIADDLAAGIWVATAPEGRFVYSNRAFDEIMGMGPVVEVGVGGYAEPYGIFGRDGRPYPESKMPFVRALQARALVVVDDIVIHRRDGRRVFVRAFAKPMLGPSGEIAHIAIVFFDITREIESERARKEVAQQLHNVVENAPVIVFAFDREAKITLVQGRALAAIGRLPSESLGQSMFDRYPEVPAIEENVKRALAGDTVNFIVEVKSTVLETWLAPHRNEAGDIVGGVGVSTDITERQRMAARLAQAERLASVGMLAAGVAHEINNPLAYVIGGLDLIARELEQPTLDAAESRRTMQGLVKSAREGAERVRVIVRDLRVVSRVEARRATAVDVKRAAEGAIELARNEIRHRARLIAELDAGVPPLWADEGRLGQLLLNLLINAAHAIPEGAVERNEVRVRIRSVDDGVQIEVSDTGVGISANELPRIFEPFFTTKAAGVGSGLGLSICHAIVTDLGGRIDVDSELGRGTTFRVLLPHRTGTPAPERPAPTMRTAAGRRGSVLVVDDEPMILRVVAQLLRTEHEVVCEPQARAALARIEQGERYDVIVCDLMMPEMTGMALHARIAEFAPEQAAAMLFVTGGAFTPTAREFVERFAEATVEKPFDATELLERVRQRVG